ncbi:MAG: tetratricopeptide repeat protein [Weeksellaceae bacterium]|jgi:tetratricopeptide (TPR) repeat protein|nr:tetratricopeptide repeat protein [Weeksellaceae bacterium]
MAKKSKKQVYTTEKVIDSLNETAHKAENFFERHSKIILSIFGVLALIGIGYFVYLKTILEPKSEKAFTEMIQADEYFKQDSVVLALKGSPGSFQGYEQIIQNYGGTKGANIALYKAGIAYYKLGDYASAVSSLEKFKSDDEILTAQKNGMIGNALVEFGKEKEALSYYVKAAEGTDLEVLQTLYYTKAGKLAIELGANQEALKYFQILANKYPNAGDGEVEKYIERLKYAISGN